MDHSIRFAPAAQLSLDAFADLFTRSFENYFYPGVTTAPILAARARFEQIDFSRSLVMYAGDEPAGQAILALRGEEAWCGGFGITVPFRGRGLARQLIAALIDQARQAGSRRFSLEVLTRNAPAIKTYLGAGLAIARDLQIFEWNRGEQAVPGSTGCAPADPAELLGRFRALHPAGAAWQRDLPALLVKPGLSGLALGEAYVVFSQRDATVRIEDLGAADAGQAATLLQALQARAAKIVSVNEPADSPVTAAFARCGFQETDRQHELSLPLASQ
ncbi:MAG TPA: GNAT family N-acetyltransferase [Herpetosiphonaceae bacterium]|nr:GNAT family N-acetyltransferase [Herpetosiphonaceae bacterium]